jgi:glycosyltransferase involved in cell wall biosynthesis
MKICFVYDRDLSSPGLVMKYATALSQGGADVRLFELGADIRSGVDGLFDRTLAVQKIITTPGSRPASNGWRRGCEYLWRSVKKPALVRRLVKEKADCYVAGDPRWLGTIALASKVNGARLVYIPFEHFPTLAGSRTARRVWALVEKLFSPILTAWICGGDLMAQEIRSAYNLGDRMHVVYNGGPTEAELPRSLLREKLGLGPEHCIVLYQGLIAKRRGLLEVIRALPQLPKNVVFAILGYGPDVDLVRQTATDVGVSDRVRIMDAVPQKELVAHVCGADIGILPILNYCWSYYYCCPSKLFECMAAGLPLAVSNMAQLKLWVESRRLGVVFDPTRPDDIAASLRRLIEDGEFRAACAENSRKMHLTEVSWAIQSGRLCKAVFGS